MWFLKKSTSASTLHHSKSSPAWPAVSEAGRASSKAGSDDWVFQPLTPAEAAAPLQHDKKALCRKSLPALHLQAANDLMANPPVWDNPLRRRGCCDHTCSKELADYRQEAIRREQLVSQQSRLSLDKAARVVAA